MHNNPSLLYESTSTGQLCRKDTGLGKRLRKWSRGHQFVVRGGGHIDTWQPLIQVVPIHVALYPFCDYLPYVLSVILKVGISISSFFNCTAVAVGAIKYF